MGCHVISRSRPRCCGASQDMPLVSGRANATPLGGTRFCAQEAAVGGFVLRGPAGYRRQATTGFIASHTAPIKSASCPITKLASPATLRARAAAEIWFLTVVEPTCRAARATLAESVRRRALRPTNAAAAHHAVPHTSPKTRIQFPPMIFSTRVAECPRARSWSAISSSRRGTLRSFTNM